MAIDSLCGRSMAFSSHDAEKQRSGSSSAVAGCVGKVSDPVFSAREHW
jgi:hypothetical protein